jgi:hypothetical protein
MVLNAGAMYSTLETCETVFSDVGNARSETVGAAPIPLTAVRVKLSGATERSSSASNRCVA